MLDVPPEIAVALDVVKALNASGRCREDAPLYTAAAELVRSYLDSAAPQGATPPPVSVPPGAPPRADAVWDARGGFWTVPLTAK